MPDHVATVKAIYEAFGRGDLAGMLAHCAEDIEWEHDWGSVPPALFQPRRGHAGVAAFFKDLADWDFLRFEPQAFLTAGNLVAVPIRIELRHRRTGRPVRDLESHWFTFAPDGKVARLRHMIDTKQVAEAETP